MITLRKGPFRLLCACATASALLVCGLLQTSVTVSATSQDKDKKQDAPPAQKKEDGKVPTAKELEKETKKRTSPKASEVKLSPAEAIAEYAIFAYGGRKQLETVRAGIHETGTIRLASDQGDITGSYNLRSIRKEKSWQDLLRIDLELTPPEAAQRQGAASSVNYVITFNGATVWSAQNNQYVTPRPEAEAAFRAQLTHDYTTLLRYKEDGSKVELVGPETVVGLETNVIDLTTPEGEKTRFWVSTKTFRVLHLEYELKIGEKPTKYRMSYYYTPLRVVQNTLVPVRRVMMQDGKFVQEVTINSFNYSAKLDPEIFQHLQAQ